MVTLQSLPIPVQPVQGCRRLPAIHHSTTGKFGAKSALNVARGLRQAMFEINAFIERNPDVTEASHYFLKIFADGLTQLNMEIAAQ